MANRQDRRAKAPRTMSKVELVDHLERFHGGGSATLWAHNHAHHMTRANHSHRSAKLSESAHADWAVA